MKDGICENISKEELKWLSKNVKKKLKPFYCKDCPVSFLAKRKNMSCIKLLEKTFEINPNISCDEINRIMYNFFNRSKQNKI